MGGKVEMFSRELFIAFSFENGLGGKVLFQGSTNQLTNSSSGRKVFIDWNNRKTFLPSKGDDHGMPKMSGIYAASKISGY